ncbi:Ribulose bisphosphate carboxylase small subunit [Rhodovastum atsumiense]|uniref:Ribulose bisphosphate carboxylase small subunit n=1 Tax=Rhodovastum atsumiense TaxID=504468 RepID=A0A5M6INN2_9PROT|nr:ribulose bisphosphate carboxylase small subunit [Rhodovastum atsumiense]KAA5609075.1 ribulose bisphosphate carboxylase small subunit [Rhodovastum atsumiense]CAH2602173.1 Ribulose bisphosphate carboxylase small subunit [Rhodovastum atsumiense]
MIPMKDYPSRLSDPNSRRLGTFSYLPPLDAAQLRRQVAYIVGRGWTPAIEHTDPAHATGHYRYMWKLPMFGETDVDRILGEIEACRAANPGHHLRLIGYDNIAQSQGTSMVVHRAPIRA